MLSFSFIFAQLFTLNFPPMKHLFTLAFGLLFISNLLAQSQPMRRFSFGLMISPDLAYRTLHSNEDSNTGVGYETDLAIAFRNKNEVPRLGFTAGLTIVYHRSAKWSFESGLQYSSKGEQIKWQELIYEMPEPSAPQRGRLVSVYHYIDVPLVLNYTPGQRRLRFIASAGAIPHFYLGAMTHHYFEYADGSEERQSEEQNLDANPVTLSATLGAGIDWKIRPHLGLQVQPTFRYGLVPMIADKPIAQNLWSLGLKTVLLFGR